ncbi:MAG: flavin reductase family protein [Paracoccaceae bacterium]|jgi:flavin reductase (DIM6/NTAB) family NADH-FMN oxidoreductase RutF|nr:flavin reductase family protein [Paracoccaceae bacterium]
MESFVPNSDNARAYRSALGQFGTGVTVVTTNSDWGRIGITANSFSSVSLDPPLILWSVAKGSKRYPPFSESEHFAIHVLGAEQADICNGFAGKADAFDGLDCSENAQGVPLINNCLARFECRKSAVHDAGDHAIMVGEVLNVTLRTGAPLLFHSGKFGEFSAN